MEVYESRTRNVSDFSKLSKFWKSLANPDDTVNSAYGWLIFEDQSCGNTKFEGTMRTPWEWAVHSLKQDKDSRQAIVKFHKREFLWNGNKDQVCTMHAIFMIREDKLNMTVIMRSNDLFFGTVFDCPFFISLLKKMKSELNPDYKNLEIGYYRHFAHSFHIYERNMDEINKMLGR